GGNILCCCLPMLLFEYFVCGFLCGLYDALEIGGIHVPAEIVNRVDGTAHVDDFVMQVRTGGGTRTSHAADLFAAGDALPRLRSGGNILCCCLPMLLFEYFVCGFLCGLYDALEIGGIHVPAEIVNRVDGTAHVDDFVMQVRTGGGTRTSHAADLFAAGDALPRL